LGALDVAEITNIKEAYSWNLTRIAEAFGIHRDTARKRIKEAGVMPSFNKGNAPHYSLSDVGPALFGVTQIPGECGGYDSPDDMPPTDRKAWFQSETERLKFQRELKTLVPDDEVAREMSHIIKAVINPLDGITDTLERKADLSPKQATAVQAEVDAIRDQMYLKAVEYEADEES
jgi:hypothetical protein